MVEFMTKKEAGRLIISAGLEKGRQLKLLAHIDSKPGDTLLLPQDASKDDLIVFLEQQLQGVISAH